jgi:hypothetical protein
MTAEVGDNARSRRFAYWVALTIFVLRNWIGTIFWVWELPGGGCGQAVAGIQGSPVVAWMRASRVLMPCRAAVAV